MGFLDRLRPGGKGRPAVRVQPDPALRHPGATAFIDELRQGHHEEALARYQALETAQLREFYVYAASDELILEQPGQTPQWSRSFADRYPDESLAWTLRGAIAIAVGWTTRGHLRAHLVDDAAWEVFFRCLNEADEALLHASELDPTDASPWSMLVILGRGLQVPPEERWLRFSEATRRGENLFSAHRQMLQGLCLKWSGSHEAMFDFAREAARTSPVASPLHALVVDAHLEMWVDLDCEPREYFPGEAREEVLHAAHQSVLHPRFQDDEENPYAAAARNVFAVGLTVCNLQREAWEQAHLIGDRLSRWPWFYFGDPAEKLAWLLDQGPGR